MFSVLRHPQDMAQQSPRNVIQYLLPSNILASLLLVFVIGPSHYRCQAAIIIFESSLKLLPFLFFFPTLPWCRNKFLSLTV